ncbi:MAG TPA: pyridoxal phosphate-dependent aminotransferase [Gemmatimonadaceae bacterium]|nr:pyridoxal phosphate-dependent aminotransferase [Gemmatimonadaceae bacterium]
MPPLAPTTSTATLPTAAASQGDARLASRMDVISGEGALDVFLRARALEAMGRRVVHLELGEPDFPTPEHVVEAGVRALQAGDTKYSSPRGLPELREAIVATLAQRHITATPQEIVVTPGAKPMVFYAMLALVEPGAEVLFPDPGFPIYPSAARFAGGIPVAYGLRGDAGYAPDLDEMAARITPRTRVLVLNAPHNPSGGAISSSELERIAELVERHDLAVITDDVYARLVYGSDDTPRGSDAPDVSHSSEAPGTAPSIAALDGMRARTIIIDSFSKTYAMTGWRLGYGVVPAHAVERLVTLAVNGHTCTPVFVQRAGIAALTGPQEPVRAMREEFARRRALVVRGLSAIPGVRCPAPAGAFYVFPDLTRVLAPHGLTAEDFATRLLEEHGVAALTGTAFGARGEGHIRISFAAAASDLAFAVDRLRECVQAIGSA